MLATSACGASPPPPQDRGGAAPTATLLRRLAATALGVLCLGLAAGGWPSVPVPGALSLLGRHLRPPPPLTSAAWRALVGLGLRRGRPCPGVPGGGDAAPPPTDAVPQPTRGWWPPVGSVWWPSTPPPVLVLVHNRWTASSLDPARCMALRPRGSFCPQKGGGNGANSTTISGGRACGGQQLMKP